MYIRHDLTLLIFFLNYFSEDVPKLILEVIDAPGWTRENVASHLQVCFNFLYLHYVAKVDTFFVTTYCNFREYLISFHGKLIEI